MITKIEKFFVFYLWGYLLLSFVVHLFGISFPSPKTELHAVSAGVALVWIFLFLLWLIDLIVLIFIYLRRILKAALPWSKKALLCLLVISSGFLVIPLFYLSFPANFAADGKALRSMVLLRVVWVCMVLPLGIYYSVLRYLEMDPLRAQFKLSPWAAKLLVGFAIYSFGMGFFAWWRGRKRLSGQNGKNNFYILSWASFDAAAICGGLIPAFAASHSILFIPWGFAALVALLITYPYRIEKEP